MELLAQTFARDESFDVEAYMREHLGKVSSRWQIVVEFHAPLYTVQQKIPAGYGTFTETPNGVRFETEHGDLADVARFLATRNLPFVALEPPELREELLRLAEKIARSAGGLPTSEGIANLRQL